MTYYVVEAIDNSGRKVVRTLEADNEVQLLSFLDFLGLTPVRVSKRPAILGRFLKGLRIRKVKRRELIDLFENLHLIAKSGVPIGVAIWDLGEDADNSTIRDVLQDISYRIQSGISISDAMARHEDVLGSVAVNLTRIGEETGRLDLVFKDISEHYARIEDFVGKAKQAFIYPAFALVSILFAMIFWLVYVMPKLVELFQSLNVGLPTATIMLMKVSGFLQSYWLPLSLSAVALVIFIGVARRKSERFRYLTDKLLLKIPVIRSILYNFNYAFFAEYMRLMLSAGVAIHTILDILNNSFNNRVFRKAISEIKESIERGTSIGDAVQRTGIFSSLFVRMVKVGEETGALEEQLEYLSNHYYAKLDYITQNIAKVIEPMVIIVVGFFMAVIMISLLVPIYELIGKIGL